MEAKRREQVAADGQVSGVGRAERRRPVQPDRAREAVRGVRAVAVDRRVRVRRGDDRRLRAAGEERRGHEHHRDHQPGGRGEPERERHQADERLGGREAGGLRPGQAEQRSGFQAQVVRVQPDRQPGADQPHVQLRGRRTRHRKGERTVGAGIAVREPRKFTFVIF